MRGLFCGKGDRNEADGSRGLGVRTLNLFGRPRHGRRDLRNRGAFLGKWDESHLSVSRLVAVSPSEDGVVGWAALARVSSRAVYGGVAEVSVYVADNFRAKGIGKALLKQLIAASEQNGIWTLQASVFPENIASLALHKICGFRVVGTRQRIGIVNGIWRDTVLLERRSEIVGN